MRYTQNRELSWLNFNKRVLEIGTDEDTPLFERLKFVAIFQSNLSEFFMIRVGGLHDMAQVKNDFRDNKSFMTAQEQLDAVYEECVPLEHQRDEVFASIEEELRDHGVYRRTWDDLDDEQLEYVQDYAESSVMPLLSAQVIDQSHPFPHLQNGKLYVAMELHRKASGADKKGGKKKPDGTPLVGIIPMPPMVPRIIRLPGDDLQYMLLEDALCSLAPQIFEMYETGEPAVICVTRNADIDPDDEDYADDDYRQHMKKILKKRTRLAPVRLQVQGHMRNMRELITRHLDLESEQVFHLESPIDLSYVYKLENELSPEQKQELLYKPFSPVWPASISRKKSMFDQIKRHDILLSYPYDSMEPFIALLREASTDPAVASIKITLYRLASISKIAECLVTAAENGKDVVVLMELRARFDEEANIGWAEHFEEAGCTVIYGMEGYKCHSKICQITRLGDDGLELYTQMATGNYNEKTAKQYTDLALMTFDKQIGIDGVDFFNNMSMGNLDGKYTKLWVSPTSFKSNVIAKVDEQIEIAKAGGRGRIIIKCNSVTDVDLIHKLAEASCAGVKIDLIVRGICCLLPGIEGETENISVISIVGRLLEHSRIYCFGEGADTTVYLASADMMTRNTERRVEIGFPVESPDIKRRVLDFVDAQLADTANASKLQPDGSYVKLSAVTKGKLFDSQQYFIDDALERASTPKKKKEKKRAARAEMVDKQMEEVRAAISEEENAETSGDTGAVVAAVAGSAVASAAAADGKDASSPKSKKKGKESAEAREAGDDLGKAPAAAAEIEAAADDADDAIEDASEPADDAGADAMADTDLEELAENELEAADGIETGEAEATEKPETEDGTEKAPEVVTEDDIEAGEAGDAAEMEAPTEPEAGEPAEADTGRAPAATAGPAIGAASAAIAAVLAGAAATAASESEGEPEETATDAPASRAEDAAGDESEPEAAAADETPIVETPVAETAAGEQPEPEDIAKTENGIEPEETPGTRQLDSSAFAAADEHKPDDKRKAQWDEQVKADEADRQKDWDAAAEVGYASDIEPEIPAAGSAGGGAAETGIGTGTEESATESETEADIEGTALEDATEAETGIEPEAASEKSMADTVAKAEKAAAPEAETVEAAAEEHVAEAAVEVGASSVSYGFADYLASRKVKATGKAGAKPKTEPTAEAAEQPAAEDGAAPAAEATAEPTAGTEPEPEPGESATSETTETAGRDTALASEAEPEAETEAAPAAVAGPAIGVASAAIAAALAEAAAKAEEPTTAGAADGNEAPTAEAVAFEELASAPQAEADAVEPAAGPETVGAGAEGAAAETAMEQGTEERAAGTAEATVDATEPAAEAEATPSAAAAPAIGAASAAIAAALAEAAAKAEEPTTAGAADGNEAPTAGAAEAAPEAVAAEEPETATESAPVKAPTEKLYRQSGTCTEQAPTEPEPASEPQADAPAAQSPAAGSEPGNAGGPTIASTAAAGSMTVTAHGSDAEDTVTVSDDTDAPDKDGTSAIVKVEHATTASFEPRKTVADNAKENAPKKKSLFSRIGSFFSRIFKRKKKPAGYLEAGDPNEYENK